MKSEIQKALGGDTSDQFADFFKLPFILAGVMIKELGKALVGVLTKIATLGIVGGSDLFTGGDDANSLNAKLKKILMNIMGAKIYLTIGPREHTDGNAFYSKMYKFEEVIFKETP